MPQAVSLIVCVPAAEAVAPCAAGTPQTQTAYVLTESEAAAFAASTQPFDMSQGAAMWAAAFGVILSLYIASRIFGSFIRMTR